MTPDQQFHFDSGRLAGIEIVLGRTIAALIEAGIVNLDIFDPKEAEQQMTPIPGIVRDAQELRIVGLHSLLDDLSVAVNDLRISR